MWNIVEQPLPPFTQSCPLRQGLQLPDQATEVHPVPMTATAGLGWTLELQPCHFQQFSMAKRLNVSNSRALPIPRISLL